jgi:hypothetical protein
MNILNQNQKHPELSAKYKLMSTQTLVDRFVNEGFELRSVSKARSPFQKHLARLLVPAHIAERFGELASLGSIRPEILIQNSYDGSSSLSIQLGLFRLVCSNGLVVGSTFSKESVRHIGDSFYDNVIDASYKILGQTERLGDSVRAMAGRVMTNEEIAELAFEGLKLRAPKSLAVSTNPETRLLNPLDQARGHEIAEIMAGRIAGNIVRHADFKPTLWNAYNRVQETLTRASIQVPVVKLTEKHGPILGRYTVRRMGALKDAEFNSKLFDIVEQKLSA